MQGTHHEFTSITLEQNDELRRFCKKQYWRRKDGKSTAIEAQISVLKTRSLGALRMMLVNESPGVRRMANFLPIMKGTKPWTRAILDLARRRAENEC